MTNVAYYKIYKDTSGYWRWRFVATNGRTIADSAEGYWNKQDAVNGVNIMKNSYNAPVIE